MLELIKIVALSMLCLAIYKRSSAFTIGLFITKSICWMGKIEVNTLVTFAWTSHTIFSSLRNAKNSILFKQSAGNLSPLYWKSENGQRGFFFTKTWPCCKHCQLVWNIWSWIFILEIRRWYRAWNEIYTTTCKNYKFVLYYFALWWSSEYIFQF